MTIITVVCSWCGKFIGEKDGQGEAGISHGMCPNCQADVLAQIRAEQERTLLYQLARGGKK